MDLNRKFLLRQYLKDYLSAVVGSKIEGANHLDFSDACLLYQIVDTPKVSYQAAYPPSERSIGIFVTHHLPISHFNWLNYSCSEIQMIKRSFLRKLLVAVILLLRMTGSIV